VDIISCQYNHKCWHSEILWAGKYFIHETCVKYLIPGKYYTRYYTTLSEWHPGYQIGCQRRNRRPCISRHANTCGLLPIITQRNISRVNKIIYTDTPDPPSRRRGVGWWQVMAPFLWNTNNMILPNHTLYIYYIDTPIF